MKGGTVIGEVYRGVWCVQGVGWHEGGNVRRVYFIFCKEQLSS